MQVPVQNLYGIGISSTDGTQRILTYQTHAPSTTDINFAIGTIWIWTGNGVWILLSQSVSVGVTTSNWVQLTTSTGGVLSVTGTANEITATTTAGAVTLSIPSTFVAPGSIASTTTITSGTGITATTGNITATNGNLVLGTAGNKLSIATGSNASVGVSAAMTTGAVTVATTACDASSIILYSRATTGGTVGQVSITAQSGTGFTLTSSSGTETSTFNWQIIN